MATPEVENSRHSQSRSTSRTASAVSSRAGSSYIFHPFGFAPKTSYDASESLLKLRSNTFILKSPQKDDDIWKRPPPDFRPQCYAPRPPKRNSREAMQPWKYGTIPGERTVTRRNTGSVRLPQILCQPEEVEENFVTSFDIPGAWEGKLMFVKEGMFKPGPYKMPKPHDFRGYPSLASLGLPEFLTDPEHDPYNLNFLSDRLDTLPGDGPAFREDRETGGIQMAPPLFQPPKWEQRLILPQNPFPNRDVTYTRYRRKGRTPHSALMERVEERLNSQWAKDQLERQLLQQAQLSQSRQNQKATKQLPTADSSEAGDKADEDTEF